MWVVTCLSILFNQPFQTAPFKWRLRVIALNWWLHHRCMANSISTSILCRAQRHRYRIGFFPPRRGFRTCASHQDFGILMRSLLMRGAPCVPASDSVGISHAASTIGKVSAKAAVYYLNGGHENSRSVYFQPIAQWLTDGCGQAGKE